VICNLLLGDNAEALSQVDELLQSTPVGIAYDRLQSACMFAISLGMKASVPPPYWNREMLQRAWDNHGIGLLSLADDLASRPIRPTGGMFKCDLLKWKIGGLQPRQVAQTFSPPILAVEAPKEQSKPETPTLSLSAFTNMVKEMVSI
jgi:hypothetical protein